MSNLKISSNNIGKNITPGKDRLKARFPSLTDLDLHYEKGKRDEMLTRVQVKIDKAREELDRIISGL